MLHREFHKSSAGSLIEESGSTFTLSSRCGETFVEAGSVSRWSYAEACSMAVLWPCCGHAGRTRWENILIRCDETARHGSHVRLQAHVE
jgi:hypothetical protein